jgi:MFS transporter, ACS family, allantoate permease
MSVPTESKVDPEKPFAGLDGRQTSLTSQDTAVTVTDLIDADEALGFLTNHPRAAEIAIEGTAILEDPVQLKKLIRKIDFTIAPLLAAVYFLQFLDKTTLSYTAVMGIRNDTHLVGQDYSDLSMLFYIGKLNLQIKKLSRWYDAGFLAAEFPTQYLAQHISRLGLYLGVNIMLWGFVLGCHAACTSFAGLAICRTLLGVFESCVAPILVLIIAMWYKKEEQGRRVSWFYVCNSLTQIFGGLLAYGVSFANTKFASWRIFFVAIGAMTMFVGALVCIILPDSPVKAKRFTDVEKVAALLRTKDNQSGTQNAHLKKAQVHISLFQTHIQTDNLQVFETFKDVRVYLVCLCTMLSSIPNGGLSNFSSILLTTFGYSSRQALILSAPSGAIGTICVLGVGYLSDKWRDRSSVMLLCILPTILGAGLMIGLDPNGVPKNKAGLLAASFLTGTFGAAFMLLLAWNASNIAGHTKKVTINALTLVSFATGNILGTQTFQAKQAPGYISGKISIIATLGILCFAILILRWYNDMLNKKNRKALGGMSEEEKVELREKMAFADQTDRKNVFFVYTH